MDRSSSKVCLAFQMTSFANVLTLFVLMVMLLQPRKKMFLNRLMFKGVALLKSAFLLRNRT